MTLYVVLGVSLVVWLSLFGYLVWLDSRLREWERQELERKE